VIRFVAALALVLVAAPASARVPDRDLAAIVERVFATGAAPGLSVAVVQDDHVWCGGWGVRDATTSAPVTCGTRFYIASTTKALTALAAARLADRGEFDLDAPLARALPGARFPAGYPADSVRVRDLLTHSHGLSGDGPVTLRMSFTGEYENADLLRLIEHHAAVPGPRRFRYSNVGYELAALAMAPERRDAWKDVVEREVLTPLGMRATTAWRSRVPDDSLAWPHVWGGNRFERVRLAKEDANLGPAGGHFSTAPDLARLVRAELHGGRLDGRQVIPLRVVAETQRAHVPQDRMFAWFHRDGWGLGWDRATFEGDRLLTRYGGFSGCFSHVSFMPARSAGVVVLVNGGAASRTAEVIAASLYDRLAGRRDAPARFQARLASLDSARAQSRSDDSLARAPRSPRAPARPWSAYAGRYHDEAFGTLELHAVEGGLEAVMGVARSPVEAMGEPDHLRVELFGGGSVIEPGFVAGDPSARKLTFRGRTFTRR
jgi:CubicO group peptidase (beta-lactamase class C family)